MDSEYKERSDRINIDESVLEFFKELSEGENKEDVPFSTMRDVFLLAACIGYEKGLERKKVPPGKKTQIRQEVFGDEGMSIMRALAIADTGDVTVLANTGQVLTIAEEYAHLGIRDLKSAILESHGRSLWNLIDMLSS